MPGLPSGQQAYMSNVRLQKSPAISSTVRGEADGQTQVARPSLVPLSPHLTHPPGTPALGCPPWGHPVLAQQPSAGDRCHREAKSQPHTPRPAGYLPGTARSPSSSGTRLGTASTPRRSSPAPWPHRAASPEPGVEPPAPHFGGTEPTGARRNPKGPPRHAPAPQPRLAPYRHGGEEAHPGEVDEAPPVPGRHQVPHGCPRRPSAPRSWARGGCWGRHGRGLRPPGQNRAASAPLAALGAKATWGNQVPAWCHRAASWWGAKGRPGGGHRGAPALGKAQGWTPPGLPLAKGRSPPSPAHPRPGAPGAPHCPRGGGVPAAQPLGVPPSPSPPPSHPVPPPAPYRLRDVSAAANERRLRRGHLPPAPCPDGGVGGAEAAPPPGARGRPAELPARPGPPQSHRGPGACGDPARGSPLGRCRGGAETHIGEGKGGVGHRWRPPEPPRAAQGR